MGILPFYGCDFLKGGWCQAGRGGRPSLLTRHILLPFYSIRLKSFSRPRMALAPAYCAPETRWFQITACAVGGRRFQLYQIRWMAGRNSTYGKYARLVDFSIFGGNT